MSGLNISIWIFIISVFYYKKTIFLNIKNTINVNCFNNIKVIDKIYNYGFCWFPWFFFNQTVVHYHATKEKYF